MREIRMVDLESPHLKIKEDLEQAFSRVMSTSTFIKGPEVRKFEENLANTLNVDHVIGCGNGTDALLAALMALNLQPGDEVITTTFSFVATIEVCSLLGLKPVLADINPETYNIDPQSLEAQITDKSKAIVPVHLFGLCADMESIMDIAQAHGLWVIEDAAQALGATYTFSSHQTYYAGTIGHIGCTSFFPSKNLGCFGDGGAIMTNSPELDREIRCIINHGTEQKYHSRRIGINSRLDALQAAILNVKLNYLDEYIEARQQSAVQYNQYLAEIPGIIPPSHSSSAPHTYNQYSIIIQEGDRDQLKQELKQQHIPSMIYYPIPFHLQDGYRYLNYKKGDFPTAEYTSKHILSLPMHTELDQSQQEYICSTIHNWIKSTPGNS